LIFFFSISMTAVLQELQQIPVYIGYTGSVTRQSHSNNNGQAFKFKYLNRRYNSACMHLALRTSRRTRQDHCPAHGTYVITGNPAMSPKGILRDSGNPTGSDQSPFLPGVHARWMRQSPILSIIYDLHYNGPHIP